MKIEITNEFKQTVDHCINKCESKRLDHVMSILINENFFDDEFGHLFFVQDEFGSEQHDFYAEGLVLDEVEKEVKNQLAKRYDQIN